MKFRIAITLLTLLILLSIVVLLKYNSKDIQSLEYSQQVLDGENGDALGIEYSLADIQGRWVSDQDNLYVMSISGEEVTEIYENISDTQETIFFVNNCEDLVKQESGIYIAKTFGGSSPLCYEIEYIDDSNLVYYYYARGNMLSFSK